MAEALKRFLAGGEVRRRIVDHALEFDVESSVISLDAAADRNVSRIGSHPDRKLTFLCVDESLWSKQFGIDSQHVNATKHRLHSLLFDDRDRNLVNLPAVADVDLETLADLERLRADEIDRRQHVLKLTGEIRDRMTGLG